MPWKLKLKNFYNLLGLFCSFYGASLYAFEYTPLEKVHSFIGQFDQKETSKVTDNISSEKNNITLTIYKKNKKLIGFARHIETTTGCSSKCLPIIYTAFYNAKGNYIDLFSKEGLTKKYHIPFSGEELSKLNLLLVLAPKVFDEVTHPEQMTDALSGATLKKYQDSVIKTAAYSTLRIHLYHQETLKHIKQYLKQNPN